MPKHDRHTENHEPYAKGTWHNNNIATYITQVNPVCVHYTIYRSVTVFIAMAVIYAHLSATVLTAGISPWTMKLHKSLMGMELKSKVIVLLLLIMTEGRAETQSDLTKNEVWKLTKIKVRYTRPSPY